MKRLPYLLAVVVCCLITACSQKNNLPDGVLPPAKMQSVLYSIMMADALNNERAIKDSTLRVPAEDAATYKKIFELHKITKEGFDKSYRFYLKHPDLLKPIADSLNSIITKKNTELETMRTDTAAAVMKRDSLKRGGGSIQLMKKDSLLKQKKFILRNKDSIKNGGNIKNAAGQLGNRQ